MVPESKFRPVANFVLRSGCSVSNSLSITTTFTAELPREMSHAAGKFVLVQCHFQSTAPRPSTATVPGELKMMSRGTKSRDWRSPGATKSIRVTAGSRSSLRRAVAASAPSA